MNWVHSLDRKAKQDAEDKRLADVQAFMEEQVERASTFPTPAQKWPYPGFNALERESVQTSFRSQYKDKLTPDEVTTTIRAMLKRWVERIIEDLASFKRGVHSLWLALTGKHAQAASSLKMAAEDHPDLAKPMFDAMHEKEEPKVGAQKQNKPKPPTPSGGLDM